jgi:hypothetical protein
VAVLYNGILLHKAPQLREYPVQEEYGYTEKTVNSTGGELVSRQISDYWMNPLKYTDPDGMADEDNFNENIFNKIAKEIEEIKKFEIFVPNDDRSFIDRMKNKDAEKYDPYFEHNETGERIPMTTVKGTPPAVSIGNTGLIGAIKSLFSKGQKALTVAKGVDLTLESGKIGQVIIHENKIVGFSKNAIKHVDLTKSLGLDPKNVTGATVFRVGDVLRIAPSSSVPGATKEALGLLYNLIH